MEAIKTLGSIITDDAHRDAVHIAIMPAIAAEDLYRGNEVGIVYGTKDYVKHMNRCYGLPAIGIVDPFLTVRVKKGQRFWVLLFPNTITSLWHGWTHPLIDSPQLPVQSEAEEWLRHFADRWNFDYDELIKAACSESDGFVEARGISLHDSGDLGSDHDLFWQHLEALTGRKFDEAHKNDFGWSCSC